MTSIPAEILIYIFRLLHQNDKLQCMLVCHEWESIIKSTVLLETLSISSKKGLDSVISNVQKEPSYGTQTKRLLLQAYLGSDFDLTILPRLFPNVYDFYINPAITLQPNCFDPWHSKLRHFFGGNRGHIGMVFESQTWSNLATLELSPYDWDMDTKDFLNPLLNTPAVKSLKLHATRFSIDDFEFIHNALPSLKSFSLTGADYTSTDPPKDIVPASNITSFSVTHNCVGTLLSRKMLFRYILQKYPNISELAIGILTEEDDCYYRHNRHVEAEFLRDEWDELLVSLAPRLQKLHLQLRPQGEYNYVLRALDRSNCQLKSLTLDGYVDKESVNLLPDINQSKYIQSLTIKDFGDGVYEGLGSMKMLTEFHLDKYFEGAPRIIDFRDILNMCGENLETLKLTQFEMSCPSTANNVTSPVFQQIKKLELECVYIPSNIGTFISRSFPQLHTLNFRTCLTRSSEYLYDMQDDFCIMLPNINLDYLEIIDESEHDYFVLVTTLCNNEKRLYTTKRGVKSYWDDIEKGFGLRDNSIYPPTICIGYDKKPATPIATIVCNSVNEIFLNGRSC